jgi:hypothetical protein
MHAKHGLFLEGSSYVKYTEEELSGEGVWNSN